MEKFDNLQKADIAKFAEILDRALQSDHPGVKDALSALMTMTILTHGHEFDDGNMGPFKHLMQQMSEMTIALSNMERRISRVESTNNNNYNWSNMPVGTGPGPAQWGTSTTADAIGQYDMDIFKEYVSGNTTLTASDITTLTKKLK